jgi:hypothetical protein
MGFNWAFKGLKAMADVSVESFALIFKGCTFHNSKPVHNTGKYSLSNFTMKGSKQSSSGILFLHNSAR